MSLEVVKEDRCPQFTNPPNFRPVIGLALPIIGPFLPTRALFVERALFTPVYVFDAFITGSGKIEKHQVACVSLSGDAPFTFGISIKILLVFLLD
jgi:hypothetical protein